MAAILGREKLVAKLRDRAAKARKDANASVIVGYSTAYALYVHENMQAAHGAAFNEKYAAEIAAMTKLRKAKKATGHTPYHRRKPDEQAKYLEQPAREQGKEIGTLIVGVLKAGRTMAQALIVGGLRLQRESMRIVPVDTGNLRASAFTKLE